MFFNRSTIRFGPRGEDIVYERSRRSVEIGFTYVDGARLYLDGLTRWSDGSPITDEDKRRLFADVVGWLRKQRDRPVVVINSDDPSSRLWAALCADHRSRIARIEYTSDQKGFEFQREMHLATLRAGQRLWINEIEITTEEELDRELRKYWPRKRTTN